MVATQQTVKAWWDGVRAGVCLGVRTLSAFPALVTDGDQVWERYKKAGIGAIRWTCSTEFNADGVPQGKDFDVLNAAIGVGLKVWLDCYGSWDANKDGTSIAQRLRVIAQEVARRGWTPEQIKLGIWFEPLNYDNVTITSARDILIATIRGVLPEHVITISGGEFASLATLTDGTFQVPSDPGCDVRINVGVDAQLGRNRQTWINAAARMDKFTADTGLFVSVGSLEFGNPGVDAELTDWGHFPATIYAALGGLDGHVPFFDGIKDNDFGLMNVGHANPMLRGEIVEAIMGALGLDALPAVGISHHTDPAPVIRVNKPESLVCGAQTITGTIEPSGDVSLLWHSNGAVPDPSCAGCGWVKATVENGNFSAIVGFPLGVHGTLYAAPVGGQASGYWSGIPMPPADVPLIKNVTLPAAVQTSDNTSSAAIPVAQGSDTMSATTSNPRPAHTAPPEEWNAWAQREAANAAAAAAAVSLKVSATGGPLPDGVARIQVLVTAFDQHGNSVGLPVVANIG